MEKRKRVHFKRPKRAVAIILVVVMLTSLVATSLGVASRVRIPDAERTLSSAAENYLSSRTEYVNNPALARITEYIRTITGQSTLQDYYALAGVQIAREEYGLALLSIEECLVLYNADEDEDGNLLIDLLLKKGCLHVLTGEFDEALPALDKVLALDPMAIDAYLVKAQVCEILGLTRDVCANLAHFLALAPGRGEDAALIAELWISKGSLHVTLGEYDEALGALSNALAIDAALSRAHLVKSQVYALIGLYREMCDSLEAYLALEPDDEEMVQLLAETREELSRPPASGNSPSLPTVEREFLIGLYAMQEEDYAAAEAAISRAIAIDGRYEGVHFYRGVCRLSLEDYSGAAEDFLASISYGHMVHISHYNRGISLIMAENYDQGREEIIRAARLEEDESVKARAEAFLLQLDEAETEVRLMQYLSLAQVCADLEDYIGLSAHLEAYLSEVPADRPIRIILAHALFSGAEYRRAMEQYVVLLEHGPEAEFEYYYGLSALKLLELSIARDAFTRAIAISEEWPDAHYYRGVCYLSLDEYETAINDFTASIRLGFMVHSSFFNRGICRLLLEDYDLGMADVRTAAGMEDDPDVKQQAKQLLDEIEN